MTINTDDDATSTNGQEKTIIALPGPRGSISKAKKFRSTWIISSLDGLRELGYFQRYKANLDKHSDLILSCIAGTWIPMEASVEHYAACDALGISDSEYIEISKAGARVRRAWNTRIVAELSGAESTPWTAFVLLHRLWLNRATDGGAVGAYRLAENRGRLDYVGCELFDIPYFRRAVSVMISIMVRSTGTKNVTVETLPQPHSGDVSYLVSW